VYYLSDAEIVHIGGRSTTQVEAEMHIHALHSMNLFFQKHYGCWYARIHRVMIGMLSFAKLAIHLARFITPRELDANTRQAIRARIHAHRRIVRWAIYGHG
jgi:hypothetical protein